MPITIDQARAAKEAAKKALADVPGLSGVGVTMLGNDYAVKVNLRAPLPAHVALPREIEGVPLHVEVVGGISKRG
jgi:hypothetical protein